MTAKSTPPDDEWVRQTCGPGKGNLTCRYLTMSGKVGNVGWSCEKFTELGRVLDRRVACGTISAQGDNCAGRGARR